MTTIILKRLRGHVLWHIRRVSRRLTIARQDPDHISLWLRNLLCRSRVVDVDGPVVSLTSYGKRIDTVFLTIESIGRGRMKPGRLILWLDEESTLADPPATLRRLVKRGLEIHPTENYRSHKKYLPYVLSADFFQQPLVTADDDVIYPQHWLEHLYAAYNQYPSVINCFRARKLNIQDGKLLPFTTWPFCNSSEPSHRHFSEGVGGVIFPPRFLTALKLADKGFADKCPRHDDVWLNVLALRNDFRVRQILGERVKFPLIPETQEDGLWVTNLGDDGDAQIRATYTAADIAKIQSEAVSSR